MTLTPKETGVMIGFQLVEGKKQIDLTIPLTKEEIKSFYKLLGFMNYVNWEEIYEMGLIEDNLLTYENYYQLLEEAEGRELLASLQLPTEPMSISGELKLDSLADKGELSLHLKTDSGQNLARMATGAGALYQINETYHLLPTEVYSLKKALTDEYENGYQKIAVCQKLATDAGVKLENFLENESYHVVDNYALEVKVHNAEHIELIPVGETELETSMLNQPSIISSLKDGATRKRFTKTNKVNSDLKKLTEKRHITGEEVPLFFENPLAVLPEHDYLFDLDQFSERVRGLIEIEKVRPSFSKSSGLSWFDENSGMICPYDEEFLRTLIKQYPEQQFVQHEGRWIYLEPTLRKVLLEEDTDFEEQIKKQYALDIKDNEMNLEYQLNTDIKLQLLTFDVPKTLQATLYPYQEEGFRWLCTLNEQGRGGLLADDMGLGKTIQVITFLLKQKEMNQLTPTLIVLPISLIENWIEEIHKFAPSLFHEIYIHRGGARLKSSEQISKYGLIFTTYDTLKIDQLILGKIPFKAIICDEAQNVKSHSGQRSRALRAMQAEFRLAVTGTPVENSLDELWAIMDFVQPGYLQSLKEFREKFVDNGNYDGLLERLRPFYLRRTKDEVLKGRLPIKHIRDPEFVEASAIQKELARSLVITKEMRQVAVLNILMRLRQLYSHPGAVEPQFENVSPEQVPKLMKVLEIIDEVKRKEEKVIIFTEFRSVHSILKRVFMNKYGISVPIIDGKTKNRQSIVKAFNDSSGFGIMLLSPKAAGVGLTITSANHVIHYTRWWNPAVENQASDRVYRIGQQKEVYVYHIITRDRENFPQGTVEELMHILLEDKQDLANNVIIPFDEKSFQKLILKSLKY